jgi:uncharacterized membrane protein
MNTHFGKSAHSGKSTHFRKTYWKVVLPLSLAVNILLLSYVGGRTLGASETAAFRHDPQQRLEMLAGLLPPADAKLLRDAYRERGTVFAVAHSNHEEAMKKILALMAQPELDLPALRAAMAKARSHNERINDLLSETLLETVQKMSANSRAAFASGF